MRLIKAALVVFGLILILLAVGIGLAAFYKKEIIAEVTAQLKSSVHADISIGDADITLFSDFPNITLRLEDVSIRDSTARPGDKELFSTERIFINLRTYKLFFREIEFRNVRILDGELFVFRDKSGHSNLDAFKRRDSTVSKSDTTAGFHLTHEKLILKNIYVSYHDSLKQKFVDFLFKDIESVVDHNDSLVSCVLTGEVDFERLTFNSERGAFLKNQPGHVNLNIEYIPDSLQVRLKPSNLQLTKSAFELTGLFDFSADARSIDLDITSRNLDYAEGLAVIPETIGNSVSVMSLDRPFGIDLHIHASMNAGVLPAISANFHVMDNVFKSKPISIAQLSFEGEFSNHADDTKPFDNRNSVVAFKQVRGVIDKLPFQAEGVISNFDDLILELYSRHDVDLALVNQEVDTTVIRFVDGIFHSDFHYRGKLNEYLNDSTGTYTGQLRGKASISEGKMMLVSRKLMFEKINSEIRFSEDTVWLDRFSASSGKSSATIDGIIANYVPFFVLPTAKGFVKLRITSPNLDLGTFLVKSKSSRKSKKQSYADKRKVSDMLDEIFNTLDIDIKLKVDKLTNKKFIGTKLSGNLRLQKNRLEVTQLQMNYGGGTLKVNGNVRDLQKEVNPLTVTAKATNVKIKELFASFSDFGQKTITNKNLEGIVFMDTKLNAKVNDDFDILMPSLTGDVSMTINDGRLIEVAAFDKMSKFLFKRRDFDNVKFAQINGKFKVTNRDLDISRMEIQSSVLTLFLEGNYNLDDKVDLLVQVPLSNLKRRDKDYVPQNVGVDAKVGPSVFLRARTAADGQTNISYEGLKAKKKSKKGK